MFLNWIEKKGKLNFLFTIHKTTLTVHLRVVSNIHCNIHNFSLARMITFLIPEGPVNHSIVVIFLIVQKPVNPSENYFPDTSYCGALQSSHIFFHLKLINNNVFHEDYISNGTPCIMYTIFREQAPISSSLNAVDLYLVVCIFFVFAALIEYAVILLLLKKRRKPRRTIDEGLMTMFRQIVKLLNLGNHKVAFHSLQQYE